MRHSLIKIAVPFLAALVSVGLNAALLGGAGSVRVGEPVGDARLRNEELAPTAPTGWYENDTQGVRETWNTLGLTGTGVTIAVIDSGVDFGNPALAGRYAVQPATLSGTQAYVGWPSAFDNRSLSAYRADPGRAWPDNWGWYVNAGRAITGSSVFTFADPLAPADVYTTPGTSQSGRYLVGYHPDTLLGGALLLAADEAAGGVYNAVYVDLDSDGAFETRMAREQPVGSFDETGDGVPDVSAGMLYWIADGLNPPPGAVVYGDVPVPPAGTLLALMIDTTGEPGGGHGTMCAGSAVGNDGGVFTPTSSVASFYTTTYGPLVQGPAPGAKVIAVGNVYAGGAMDAWYLFAVLGLDGAAGSGDEPQIVTLSYGSGDVDNDGWDWESRYLASLNLTYGDDSPLFVISAGNGGFGYGTLISPKPATGLIAGASTQYGTFNGWGISETVSLPSRANTGDVTSFSGRGPGADGTRAVDLVANGMAGTGAYPLNVSGDGTRAYVHWNGTSRSAPVVGGMAALAAQAFRQAHGRFPTYVELRRLLVNSARDLGYDPLMQGAGQANAFRAAQAALGQRVTIEPPAAVAGDFRGQRYPAFAAGLVRGQVQTLTFTATNPTTAPVMLALGAHHLVEVARIVTTLQTITDTATNYGKGVPDYALDLTGWVTAHPDADLLVVRMQVPFEHFDGLPPDPPTVNNRWRLVVYNWWGDNADGRWWTDLNGDGRVDWPGEIDGGDEWMRFDYGFAWGYGPQQEVRVGRPYARSIGAGSGGIWAGAAHFDAGKPPTTLTFEVLFYRQVAWPEVGLSTDSLYLPAGGQATFQATVRVPLDAPYGLRQGAVVVTGSDRSLIPLTWQVWPVVTDGVTLGGMPRADTPYDNGQVRGGIAWGGRKETGDWRFYGLDLQDPPPGSVILVHNTWEDYPTDVDTLILGPTPDDFSDANPAWFGPYGLDIVGGSARVGSRPNWEFETATGATEEWASAPVQAGLHVLAQHAVLFGGHQTDVPFTTAVGLASVAPHPLRMDPARGMTYTITATFRAGLDIADGITVSYAFGWFTPTVQSTLLITQGGAVVHNVFLSQSPYRLDVTLRTVAAADDLDVYLYADDGALPGAWDTNDQLLDQETGPGVDKSLRARGLTAGQYWVLVKGQAVDAGGGSYALEAVSPPWDSYGAMHVEGLPAHIVAGQTYTFTVQASRPFTTGQQGLLVLGPPVIPNALEVLVVVADRRVFLPVVTREALLTDSGNGLNGLGVAHGGIRSIR